MNRFMEMSHVELAEALENSINSIEASGGTGDWYDAVVEARRRLSMQAAAQTFYVMKRDEEPRYWYYLDTWDQSMERCFLSGDNLQSQIDYVRKNNPTARIVKVMVSEVDG